MRSSAVHLLCLIERAVLQRAMRGDGERTRDRLSLLTPRLPRQGALAQKGQLMKMQKAAFICVTGILSLLSSTSSFATDVKSDYDRAADFGRYKKYCWQKVDTQNPLWIERIKTALNSALAVKGWSQTESGSACDISIVAIEIKRNHDTVNTFYDNFGGGWGWRGFGADGFGEATTTTDTYQTGTLIVDLFDAKTKNLVWRGSATDTLSDKSDKNMKKLNKSVSKLFEHFPPQPKK
jgi:Domain of unknown function (DUF4136)